MDRAEIIERLTRLREKAARDSVSRPFERANIKKGPHGVVYRPSEAATRSRERVTNALNLLALDAAIGAVTREEKVNDSPES